VNEAWRIVKDPIRRAEALFRLAGIAVGETNEPRPSPMFLMEMMEEREALAEARAGRDLGRVRALGERVRARAAEAERSLAAGLDGTGTPAAPLVGRLGELRFYRRFLDEVAAIEAEEEERELSS